MSALDAPVPNTAADDRQRMLRDVPATTRTLDVDGTATAVLELGEGPPLLLLHGGIECGGAMWAPVLAPPTTLLWGRHDRMVPLGVGEAAASRHGWPLHVIDGTAHATHIEAPDAFVQTLRQVTSTT